MKRKITIIGDGAWGTALAILLARNNYKIYLWSPFPHYAKKMAEYRENKDFLPGFMLPDAISVTSDPQEAMMAADAVVIAVPTKYTNKTLDLFRQYVLPSAKIISVSKGFDSETKLRLSELIKQKFSLENIAALSGPSYAIEVAKGLPTAVTIASANHDFAVFFQKIFNCQCFRVYTSQDIIGVELGGTLKNIIAIAAGVSDGLGFGDNTKAALITRGLAEITRLGVALGASPATFAGLSGMGDLILTCTGKLSRNRAFGEQIGKGAKAADILATTKNAIEGAWNCEIAKKLAEKANIEVPIITQVCNLINGTTTPIEAVNMLLSRSAKPE